MQYHHHTLPPRPPDLALVPRHRGTDRAGAPAQQARFRAQPPPASVSYEGAGLGCTEYLQVGLGLHTRCRAQRFGRECLCPSALLAAVHVVVVTHASKLCVLCLKHSRPFLLTSGCPILFVALRNPLHFAQHVAPAFIFPVRHCCRTRRFKKDEQEVPLRLQIPAWKRVPPLHDTIAALRARDYLPAIWFVFSRRGCDEAAVRCFKGGMTLTTAEQAAAIEQELEALRWAAALYLDLLCCCSGSLRCCNSPFWCIWATCDHCEVRQQHCLFVYTVCCVARLVQSLWHGVAFSCGML